ncbi:hypothetical protein B0J14DRAFT_560554 [Halenospora varia]|nr:hypothetical protein B0J14DRAFT_560554 [Halenospora varia]
MHGICCLWSFQHSLFNQLRDMLLDSDRLVFSDQEAILNNISDHFDFFEEENNQLALIFGEANRRTVDMVAATLEEQFHHLEEVVKESQTNFDSHPTETALPELSQGKTFKAKGRPQWPNMKLFHAKIILNKIDARYQKQLQGVMRSFFTSPDIAPSFEHVKSITRNDYFNLVDSFIDDQFSFSHGNRDRISAIKGGWELVDEMPIAGPPRMYHLVAPPQADEFEGFLKRDKERIMSEIKVGTRNRKVTEEVAVGVISRIWPHSNDESDILHLLAYFARLGKFFRYTQQVTAHGTPILSRLGNSWDLPPSTHYAPNPNTLPEKPYYETIRNIIRSFAGRSALKEKGNWNDEWQGTEVELYDILHPHLNLDGGGWFGRRRKVSRFKFHMFLKWCDEEGVLFE